MMAEYISREELVIKNWYGNTKPLEWRSYTNELIKSIPAADVVEVNHGKWYLHPDGSGTCSNCNRTQKSVWDFDNVQNYCGNCGTKMDGERRDTE